MTKVDISYIKVGVNPFPKFYNPNSCRAHFNRLFKQIKKYPSPAIFGDKFHISKRKTPLKTTLRTVFWKNEGLMFEIDFPAQKPVYSLGFSLQNGIQRYLIGSSSQRD